MKNVGPTLTAFLLVLGTATFAQPGSLDATFGMNGKVTTDFGTFPSLGGLIAIQLDGMMAGYSNNGTDRAFTLARYNTGGNGKVTTSFESGGVGGNSVAVQPDGKIVVAGTSQNGTDYDFAAARYLSGLNIGIIDLSLTNSAPLIYPNPIQKHATLNYTLQNMETISIELLDMQGKTVQTFIEGQQQAAGAHQQAIDLAETLPAGSYLIPIPSAKGRFAVQVVK